MKQLKLKFEYEPIKLPYVLERTYCPDFRIGNVLIEAKGVLDADTRAKMIAVKKAHPSLDIRIIFMCASNKLSRNSKTTYAQWAEKNGFPWAEGKIPEEWLESLHSQ